MTSAPLSVAETDRIAALLAEVMPHVAVPTPPPAPFDALTQNVRAFRAEAPPPQPEPPPTADRPVRDFFGGANWRNEPPDAERNDAPPRPPAVREVGPLPAPVGTLTLAAMFGLVNWRNRADEARPLPIITPPPVAGAEFTVQAMLTTFGWE